MSKRQQNKSKAQAPVQDSGSKYGWKVLITTASEVNVWNGVKSSYDTLFTSGSEGIVSARLAKEGNVLAVAGSEVVLLHRIEKGQQQSYKLKGTNATRLLEYAADGKTIFLNSSLKSSIQTYNVKDDKITETLKSHPSPVTCFTSSIDSTLLISASSNPPTIHLDNLSLRTSSLLKPKASDHRVIIASFHPSRKNIFLLAFSDGVLAAYDYSKASKSGQHIHAFGHLHDAMMGGNGITAAEFIPGSQTKGITGGEDGRCLILDFDKKDVIGSFHVGAPVTCLSVRSEDNTKKVSSKWLVAVGTLHGWCYVYDQDGNRVHEVQVDPEGNKVIEVSWKLGDIKLPVTAAPRPSAEKAGPSKTPTHASESRQITEIRAEDPIIAAEKPAAPIQFSAINKPKSPHVSRSTTKNSNKPLPKEPSPEALPEVNLSEDVDGTFAEEKPAWEDLQHGFTADYMSIFSPVKNAEPLRQSTRRSSRLSIRSTQSPTKTEEDKIAKLIQQDEDGLLRPSVSSPSLATKKPGSSMKMEAPAAITRAAERPTVPRVLEKDPIQPEPKPEVPITSVVEPTQPLKAEEDVPPIVPLKDNVKPVRASRRQSAEPLAPSSSLPSTDSKAVEDFRKVREKIESSHGHPVLSLFSSHLPNHRPTAASGTTESDKENSSNATKVDSKAEKKRVKMEERERKKTEKEEKRRKKKEGSFPPVSDLVFKDDDMDIDGPAQHSEEQRPQMEVSPPLQNLELPSIASKIGSTKRKAAYDPYDLGSSSAPKPIVKTAKGKEKAKSPPVEVIAEDIWMPDEVRKPSKRVNFGDPGPRQLHDGTMSIHDLIADLKATFKEEMLSLRTNMEERFSKQNEFFEGLIKSERSESRALRVENERLKAEIQELLSLNGSK